MKEETEGGDCYSEITYNLKPGPQSECHALDLVAQAVLALGKDQVTGYEWNEGSKHHECRAKNPLPVSLAISIA